MQRASVSGWMEDGARRGRRGPSVGGGAEPTLSAAPLAGGGVGWRACLQIGFLSRAKRRHNFRPVSQGSREPGRWGGRSLEWTRHATGGPLTLGEDSFALWPKVFSAQGQMGNISGPGAVWSLSLLLTAARVALTALWTNMWLCANKPVGESR